MQGWATQCRGVSGRPKSQAVEKEKGMRKEEEERKRNRNRKKEKEKNEASGEWKTIANRLVPQDVYT